jgi:hypothetical protein
MDPTPAARNPNATAARIVAAAMPTMISAPSPAATRRRGSTPGWLIMSGSVITARWTPTTTSHMVTMSM